MFPGNIAAALKEALREPLEELGGWHHRRGKGESRVCKQGRKEAGRVWGTAGSVQFRLTVHLCVRIPALPAGRGTTHADAEYCFLV